MTDGIEEGDVSEHIHRDIVNPDGSVSGIDPRPIPGWENNRRPRRLRQPTKDRLREQLALAASEIERWKGEVDRLAAQLEGEGKSFGVGVIAGWLSVLLVWWIK